MAAALALPAVLVALKLIEMQAANKQQQKQNELNRIQTKYGYTGAPIAQQQAQMPMWGNLASAAGAGVGAYASQNEMDKDRASQALTAKKSIYADIAKMTPDERASFMEMLKKDNMTL